MSIPWSRANASIGSVSITGGATETKQDAIIAALGNQATEAKQDEQLTRETFEIWDLIAGNSKEITYFTGVTARNPSGNTDNVDQVILKTGAATILTQTFTYDINDNVTLIDAA